MGGVGRGPGRRVMARRLHPERRIPGWTQLLGVAVVIAVVLGAGSTLLAGQSGGASGSPSHSPQSNPPVSVAPPFSPTPTPSLSLPPSGAPTPTPVATPADTLSPTESPSAIPTRDPNGAPQSADDFDLRNQVIDITFPLRPETHFHYRDNYLDPRAGPPDDYNHAKPRPDGSLRRLHDGIDIYGPEGEPVVAPFSGLVIDPATRWLPWEPNRYGLTVVIESDEPTSDGYTAVMVHLEKVWVDIGQRVSRGQVIGVLGRTGNAEEVKPQLHFELRAPFLIDWSSLGEDRPVDAFNPYPSLIAADPHV